jgi:hypothetical protein
VSFELAKVISFSANTPMRSVETGLIVARR